MTLLSDAEREAEDAADLAAARKALAEPGERSLEAVKVSLGLARADIGPSLSTLPLHRRIFVAVSVSITKLLGK